MPIPVDIAGAITAPPGINGARNGSAVLTIGATFFTTFLAPSHTLPKKFLIFLKKPGAIFTEFYDNRES